MQCLTLIILVVLWLKQALKVSINTAYHIKRTYLKQLEFIQQFTFYFKLLQYIFFSKREPQLASTSSSTSQAYYYSCKHPKICGIVSNL